MQHHKRNGQHAADQKPAFLITIDTEGDDLWSRPREITTRNAEFLPRFQQLCERYGFKPTWLVDYEMACCPVFGEFGRDVLAYSILTRSHASSDVNAEVFASAADLPPSLGLEDLVAIARTDGEFNDLWAGISYSRALGSNVN